MREDPVSFFSEGVRIAGLFRTPNSSGPWPAVAQGPGWLGLKDAALYLPYHEALTAAGVAVFIFDYRGFGDSDGKPGEVSLRHQVEDLVNAFSFLESRPDVATDQVGIFGSGGTGGGNAILAAATLQRVRATVTQVPVADGGDWLRRMRREYEWFEFLRRLAEDRSQRVTSGEGVWVDPRTEIMIAPPERKEANVKRDVDSRVPTSVPLSLADELLAYRPIDHVSRVGNLLVIGVEDDAVTPTDHAVDLYQRAAEPKRLIMQRHTTHYAAYKQYGSVVIPEIVDWFLTHLAGRAVEAQSPSDRSVLRELP